MPMRQAQNSEFDKFSSALRSVLSVSHDEMKRRLEAEKLSQAGKPKRGPKPKRSMPVA